MKNLVLEDVTPDAPCGCEIVGGYNFCNFDYGFTGFCELCSYYITNEVFEAVDSDNLLSQLFYIKKTVCKILTSRTVYAARIVTQVASN